MATVQEISSIVILLSNACANPPAMTQERLDAYVAVWSDIDFDLLRAAVTNYIGRETFFPTPGQIRKEAIELARQVAKIPSAFEAWEYVLRMPKDCTFKRVVEENGQYIIETVTVGWLHPLVEQAAKQLGFPDFPKSDEEGVDRAHFVRAYEALVNQAVTEQSRPAQVQEYLSTRQGQSVQALIGGIVKRLEAGK